MKNNVTNLKIDLVDRPSMENDQNKPPQDQIKSKKTLSPFMNCLHGVTIEPMMFIMAVARTLAMVTRDQMLLYKTCKDPKFNLTDDFCSNIEENANTTEYSAVEAEMADFNNIISIAEQTIPILLSFYLGSWSDQWGRKPFLLLCMTGKTVSAIMNLVNSIFLNSWTRWVWLATVVGPSNVSGGHLCFILMAYAFMADQSSSKQRTLRLGILSFAWHVSTPVATPLGAFLFETGGYQLVFGASVALCLLAWILIIIRLWGFDEKLKKRDENVTLIDMIHPKHIIDTFKVVFKPRTSHKRAYMITMMAVMLTSMFPMCGEIAFEFLYTKRFFAWDVTSFSWYRTIHSLSGSIGMITLLPLFHYFKVNDNTSIIVAIISMIGANLLRGLSLHPWLFFVSAGIDIANAVSSPPIRAQMTRCVEPHELGKVFAMLASIESVVPIVGTNTYTAAYKFSRDLAFPLTGLCYFITCLSLFLGLLMTVVMAISLKCGPVPLSGEEGSINNSKSNLHPEDWKNKDKEVYCVNYIQYDDRL